MMDLTGLQLTEALDALTHDGDTYDVEAPDGATYTVKLVIEQDPDVTINDYDCYGKASHAQGYHNDRQERPAGFDGSARKVWVSRSDWVWWQPADDMRSAKKWGGPPDEYPAALSAHIQGATELLRDGFHLVVLDLYETLTDGLGHDHTVAIASYWLGGLDSLDPTWLRDIISDGLAELEAPWDEPNPAEGRG